MYLRCLSGGAGLGECQIEGRYEEGFGIVVVLVASLFAIFSDLVVGEIVVVVRVIVGRAVDVGQFVAVGVFGYADLRAVGDGRIARQRRIHAENDLGFDRLTGGKPPGGESVAGREGTRGLTAILRPGSSYQSQLGGNVIGYGYETGGYLPLIDDRNFKENQITGFYGSPLSLSERFDQCQIEGRDRHLCGIVVVFVAAIFTILPYFVVGKEVVVRYAGVGRAVHVGGVHIPCVVFGTADLRKVLQGRIGIYIGIYGQYDVEFRLLSGIQIGNDAGCGVATIGPSGVTGGSQGHSGRDVVRYYDVLRIGQSLVDHRDRKGHIGTRSDLRRLTGGQGFDQCQVKRIDGYFGGVAIILVAAVLAVSGHVVVVEEGIVVGNFIGGRIDVLYLVVVGILGTADLG